MKEIDGATEVGAFVRWRHVDPNNKRNRESVRVYVQKDVGDTHDDWVGGVNATLFRQVSQAVDLMAGVGATFAGDDYFNTYFGVNAANVGTSGLPLFEADGGAKDVRATLGAIVHFSLDWHLGMGVQYRKLLGDASDSPIVADRGDDNQWIGGLALIYAWGNK
jgi:outer membrane scaffolding protein for murein synthesis (MipA/OmpV family)